ncbi:MAG: hypothetical protein OXQ89_19890 [Rhodospirillaceae bacterium]|nr:hypothetical protein [Rhodospirillaceae bacterium]MDE0361851.1 hypothetical protein [Rhodospirillaceae bacterium]
MTQEPGFARNRLEGVEPAGAEQCHSTGGLRYRMAWRLRWLLVLCGWVFGAVANAQTPDFLGRYVGELRIVEPGEYVLTEQGQGAYDNYDPDYGDPRQWDDCEPEGIPAILLTPGVATVDLLQVNGAVEMHFERDDAVRVIHLDEAAPPPNQAHTALGYSRGSWDGDVFVIETTHLTGGVIIAQTSYPMSQDATVEERYWREPGENNLRMEVTVEDPLNYGQPVTIGRVWVWSPDAPKHPWNCVSLGPRHTDELDIDELRRRLEAL